MKLFRRRHKLVHYSGLGGSYSPGYEYCRVCHHRWPDVTQECGGPEEGKRWKAAEARWWRYFREHQAAGEMPPENF